MSAVFIGRVGALAVALGVGSAIAGGTAVATAEGTDSRAGSGSNDTSSAGISNSSTESTATPGRTTRASESESKPQSEPKFGSESGSEAQAESESGSEAQAESESGSEAQAESESGSEAQADLTAPRSTGAAPQRTTTPRTRSVRTARAPERTDTLADGNDPVPTPADAAAAATLGAARREVGHDAAEKTALVSVASTVTPGAALTAADATVQPAVAGSSPLGTPQQLAAERLAQRIANSIPVKLVKLFLKAGFTAAAHRQFDRVGGPDQENLARLDAAVDAYAMAAAFQQQLLNSARPTVVMQVAPPHTWYGQSVGASRILYDNPDTIYRFMGVNGASSYVITGKFADPDNLPADTSFSVLTGLTGNTAAVLTKDQLVLGPDGSFTITVDRTPAGGRTNHLQLTADTTIIATRNTLSDWATQTPMSLEITRVGGPPNSLFSQLGGFAIPGIGPTVVRNPVLTKLVSLIPPLPYVPTVLRGAVAAVIMALGVQREETYMKVATTDPSTGERIDPNVLKNPTRNAEFLATQLQSAGYFQLADDEALVITIDRGSAGYFVVPVTDDWTVTEDYWNEQTSLNNAQAEADDAGATTYTIVVSPGDPGVANWVSTGGLNQGTISIRFQDLDPDAVGLPTVNARVVRLQDLPAELPPATRFLTAAERATQIAARKAAFDLRFAPYPQP